MNDSDKELVERAVSARDLFKHQATRHRLEQSIHNCGAIIAFWRHHEIEEARHDLRLIAGMGQQIPVHEHVCLYSYHNNDLRLIASTGQQWQPINKNTPLDKPVLLGWWETHPEKVWKYEAGIAGHENNLGTQVSNGWLHGQATHWMPLPEAPQKEEPK